MNNLLLLSSLHDQLSKRSGYQVLSDYLQESDLLITRRKNSNNFFLRLGSKIARKSSFSSWYAEGSLALEIKAFNASLSLDKSIIHFLWADLDLGFLDLFIKPKHRLCGTFHNCSDTIGNVIRFPERLKRFDAVILMSDTQRPFFVKAGLPQSKIHTVLHGVDTHYFTPPNARSNDQLTVLSVGGYRRNFYLLRQVCILLKEYSKIRFEIVGPQAVKHLFDQELNVIFYENISDHELLIKYQRASCFLLAVENSTANNALLESMACGLPVIAERIGGIPEYVNRACAFLAEPGNSMELAGYIKALADSNALREEMGMAARLRAQELDWQKTATQMLDIYSQLN